MDKRHPIRGPTAWFFAVATCAVTLANAAEPRLLVLGVESVPYELVVRLTDPALGDAAILKNLNGPAAVVNTFPSSSYPAWSGLLEPLGVDSPAGFTAKYFSRERGVVTGRAPAAKSSAPWHDFFDWKITGLARKASAYGRSRTYSVTELKDGLAAFMASDKSVFFLYLTAPDAIGHLHGPEGLAQFMRQLDATLAALRIRHPEQPFHTLMISDHGIAGGEKLRNTWPNISKAMEAAGFDSSNALRDANDVVFIPLGLLTNFVAYSRPGSEGQIAKVLVEVEGVDLCVIPAGDGWRVVSGRGDAQIHRSQGSGEDRYRYQTLSGDPLDYAGLVPAVRACAGGEPGDALPDSCWLKVTQHSHYPDALYRLARSFDIVDNAPSVGCSVSEGHVFGALRTELVALPTIGRLRWTHGALHRDASLGFMMSDLPDWQPGDAVRFNQALAFLQQRLLAMHGADGAAGSP